MYGYVVEGCDEFGDESGRQGFEGAIKMVETVAGRRSASASGTKLKQVVV